MTIFSKPLPDGYVRHGREYKMRTDFKVWLKVEGLLCDNDIAPDMKFSAEMKLIFPVIPPPDSRLEEFVSWFLRCGEEPHSTRGSRFRAYSSDHDEGYIYAAFMQQYRIDLAETDMHWWKYQALFRGLRETKFTDIAGWRSADIDNDMPKSRREFLEDMQEYYALPETLTDRQLRERSQNFYRNGGG